MKNIDITRMSSKGQVVIPQDMRENINEGDKLVIIQNDNQIILKKVEDFDKNIEEDLEFARKTEESYKRYEKGKFVEMEFDDFIKMLSKIKDGKNSPRS